MHETRGFKIFICLILTAAALVLWMYMWNHWTSNVGQTTYKDAVFVDNGDCVPGNSDVGYDIREEGADSFWSV